MMGDLCTKQVSDFWEECVMSEPQEQATVPSHWHVFRREEDGSKQYMLPFYSKQSDALAAVTALKITDHRTYEVEECQDPTCQT
jgi:hypothetical protein